MSGLKRKEQVIVDEAIVKFLDAKVKKGFKRSSYIRHLIYQAMKEEKRLSMNLSSD
jgi:hypothetical protein